jgi:hypothetical protein
VGRCAWRRLSWWSGGSQVLRSIIIIVSTRQHSTQEQEQHAESLTTLHPSVLFVAVTFLVCMLSSMKIVGAFDLQGLSAWSLTNIFIKFGNDNGIRSISVIT